MALKIKVLDIRGNDKSGNVIIYSEDHKRNVIMDSKMAAVIVLKFLEEGELEA